MYSALFDIRQTNVTREQILSLTEQKNKPFLTGGRTKIFIISISYKQQNPQ